MLSGGLLLADVDGVLSDIITDVVDAMEAVRVIAAIVGVETFKTAVTIVEGVFKVRELACCVYTDVVDCVVLIVGEVVPLEMTCREHAVFVTFDTVDQGRALQAIHDVLSLTLELMAASVGSMPELAGLTTVANVRPEPCDFMILCNEDGVGMLRDDLAVEALNTKPAAVVENPLAGNGVVITAFALVLGV